MTPIMLATDGSPSARAATDEAIELAQSLKLPLTVVCVAHDQLPLYGSYGYADIVLDLRKAQQTQIAKVFASVKEQAAAANIRCDTLSLEGYPGEVICRAASEQNARMIVIGAHGWGRVGRLIHGSVSTYVLHNADTAVLVVQSNEPPKEDANVPTHAGAAV